MLGGEHGRRRQGLRAADRQLKTVPTTQVTCESLEAGDWEVATSVHSRPRLVAISPPTRKQLDQEVLDVER
jgi:hypothetical protein